MGPAAGLPETQRTVESLRKHVPEPILAHYDRLRVRGKKGVALVRHGVCSGCQMKLATGVHASLLRNEDIAMCDSCARYLLVAPELPVASSEPPAPVKKPPVRRPRRKAVPPAEEAPST